MSIREQLQSELARTGWSVYRLVKSSGVDQSTVYNLVNGKRASCKYETAQAMFDALKAAPTKANA